MSGDHDSTVVKATAMTPEAWMDGRSLTTNTESEEMVSALARVAWYEAHPRLPEGKLCRRKRAILSRAHHNLSVFHLHIRV